LVRFCGPTGRSADDQRSPGNVLWSRGWVSGIVDWVNASLGAPEAEAGHCRANLAGHFDQTVADRFLARYQALTGRAGHHPYWASPSWSARPTATATNPTSAWTPSWPGPWRGSSRPQPYAGRIIA